MIRPSGRDGMHVMYDNFEFEKTEIFFIRPDFWLDMFSVNPKLFARRAECFDKQGFSAQGG
jgi:hypothetical protein